MRKFIALLLSCLICFSPLFATQTYAADPPDKTALQAEIARAESLRQADYTVASWNAMQTALTNARTQYNSTTANQTFVDMVKTLLTNAINELVLAGNDITVKFRLIGDSIHDTTTAPQYTDWISERNVTVPAGSKVYDVFMLAIREAGLSQTGADSDYVSSITKGGVRLAEFTNGRNSGWKYLIGPNYPGRGLRNWPVNSGDVIVWHYINDYNAEDNAWVAAWPNLPPRLQSITVTPPTKLTYNIGDQFKIQGLSVKAVWAAGSQTNATDYKLTLPGGAELKDNDALRTAGTFNVTVTFQGKTTTFEIKVNDNSTTTTTTTRASTTTTTTTTAPGAATTDTTTTAPGAATTDTTTTATGETTTDTTTTAPGETTTDTTTTALGETTTNKTTTVPSTADTTTTVPSADASATPAAPYYPPASGGGSGRSYNRGYGTSPAAPPSTPAAPSQTVNEPSGSVSQIVNTSKDMTLESGPVKVSIPAGSLAGIAKDGSSLKLIVRHADNIQPVTVPLNQLFTVELLVDDVRIEKLDGLQVTVKLSEADAANPDARWIVAVQGEDIIKGSYDAKTGEFTFKTDGSGDFILKPAILMDMSIGNRAFTRNGNQSNMDVAPVIKNDRTLVPVRFIAEALGAKVGWDGGTQTVSVNLGGKNLSLVVGQTGPGLDAPAEIIDDRTMVPLRYISENFGARVDYNAANKSVAIARVVDNLKK